MESGHVEALKETIDGLRLEVAELQASRKRVVVAADDGRRTIERELHEGVQQHLVALGVNLQLLGKLAHSDPPAAQALLEQLERDLQHALDEAARLAQRIRPPLLETRGGLAIALRAAAASADTSASIDVAADGRYPTEVTAAVYWCCVDLFEHVDAGARVAVNVREKDEALVFEVVTDGGLSARYERLRDRVEAFGGRLTIDSEPAEGTRISGALPLARDATRSQPDTGRQL